MPELQSQCEDLWLYLDLVGNKSLVIEGYNKPKELEPESFLEFFQIPRKGQKKILKYLDR